MSLHVGKVEKFIVDPYPDLDHCQNLTDWCLAKGLSFHLIQLKSVNNFLRYLANRQTDKHKRRISQNLRNFVGGSHKNNGFANSFISIDDTTCTHDVTHWRDARSLCSYCNETRYVSSAFTGVRMMYCIAFVKQLSVFARAAFRGGLAFYM